MKAFEIINNYIAKGEGRTGKPIKGQWDPVRGHYIYPEQTKDPLARPDFQVDRPTHKQRDYRLEQKMERKTGEPHDPVHARLKEMAEEFMGEPKITGAPGTIGAPQEKEEHVEKLREQAAKQRKETGVEEDPTAAQEKLLQDLKGKKEVERKQFSDTKKETKKDNERGGDSTSKSISILNNYLNAIS